MDASCKRTGRILVKILFTVYALQGRKHYFKEGKGRKREGKEGKREDMT